MTVHRLLQEMPTSEFFDWVKYYTERQDVIDGKDVVEHDWENMDKADVSKAFNI